MKDVIIVGGGIAGLIAAIQLSKENLDVLLIEKGSYPSHRVCGEYVSNEVTNFLRSIDAYPEQFSPPIIKRFQLSSTKGRNITMPLDLGGFGISRFTFDNFLYEKAKSLGTQFLLKKNVEAIHYENNSFRVKLPNGEEQAKIVIGAFGKRSKLDHTMDREFIKKRSPYLGVKYHILCDQPKDLISIHNFEGGYCGLSQIEDEKFNLCYLANRNSFKKYGKIEEMEKQLLQQNPFLKDVFTNSDFLFERPVVINEISFDAKKSVENHVLMIGDSAGLITPLCGNGMAMAIHSSKILCELIIQHYSKDNFDRQALEDQYKKQWKTHFANRLWYGRSIQKLYNSSFLSEKVLATIASTPTLSNFLMKKTHGTPI